MTKMILFATLLLTLFSVVVSGQGAQMALDRVNALAAPDNVLQIKGKQLMVDGFREGQKVKTDRVNFLDLDPASVAFDTETSVVSVACFAEMGECVQRQQYSDGRKNFRWRIAFDVKDSAHSESLMNALTELLNQLHKK